VWAAVGAIVCGILVATVPEGSVSLGTKLMVLTALLLGVATTVIVTLLSFGNWRLGQSASLKKNPVTFQNDREIVHRLDSLVQEREINWLLTADFAEPWRDDRVASLRSLELLLEARQSGGLYTPEVEHAVGSLTDAARAFFSIYDSSTIVDPMMRDASWRMIGQSGPGGDEVALAEHDRLGSQTRLREAATEICERYEAVSVISEQKRPPLRRASAKENGAGT
jgi:hypothetical protein